MSANEKASWYDAERVAFKGSVILTEWNARRQAERAATVKNDTAVYPTSSGTRDSQLYEWLSGGNRSASGLAVTERTAMSVGALYGCISLISGAVVSMPLHIYKRTKEGRERVDSDLWWLLNEQPTPAYSAAVFWEYLFWSMLLHGDAFARIRRASPMSPVIEGFELRHPLDVTPVKNGNRLAYRITHDGETETVDQDDVLHIPGLGFNGLRGMSPLQYNAKQAIGIALASDEYSARFFNNGARPDIVITTGKPMNEEQSKLFRETWMARYSGVFNSHLPAILSGEGADIKALGLKPEDAQLIETRGYRCCSCRRDWIQRSLNKGYCTKRS